MAGHFRFLFAATMVLAASSAFGAAEPAKVAAPPAATAPPATQDIALPPARSAGQVTVEAALAARGKVQSLEKKQLALEQISQLAAAVYGISSSEKASSTAAQSLTMYFVMDTGVYVYKPETHSLGRFAKGDKRAFLAGVVSSIRAVSDAPCSIVLTVSGSRLGEATLIATGRASAAIDLQALAMGLGTVTCEKIGAAEVAEALGLPADRAPVCVMAVGYPANGQVVVTSGTGEVAAGTTQVDRVLVVVPPKGIVGAEYEGISKALAGAGFTTTIACTETGSYRTTTGKEVIATVKLSEVEPAAYEGVVFLGGLETRQYYQDAAVRKIAVEMARLKKPVAAISTAPRILLNAGLLTGVRATANSTERQAMAKEGAVITGADVERDVTKDGGAVVTSVGGRSAVPKFAHQVIAAIRESATRNESEKLTEREKSKSRHEGPAPQSPASPGTPAKPD
jgi:putative intracellular protease/amidase/nitroreductase